MGYSPWGRKELDTMELSFIHTWVLSDFRNDLKDLVKTDPSQKPQIRNQLLKSEITLRAWPTYPEGINHASHGPTPPLLYIYHDACSTSLHLFLKHLPFKKNFLLTWIILKSLLNLLQHCLCCLCSSFFSWRHVGSWLPNKGSNSHFLHWKAKSLTTRLPGKSQYLSFLIVYKTYTKDQVLFPTVTLCFHIVT